MSLKQHGPVSPYGVGNLAGITLVQAMACRLRHQAIT